MAENGIRQLGHLRIGVFAVRLRPEPMHCEINAWQHYLDLLYVEAIHRNNLRLLSLFCEPLYAVDISNKQMKISNQKCL